MMTIRRTGAVKSSLPSSFLALALALSGCAAKHQAAADALLKEQSAANMRARLVESSLGDLEERLNQVEAVLRQQGTDAQSGLATVEGMRDTVAALRGQTQELLFANEELRAELEGYQLDQESRLLRDEQRIKAIEAFLGIEPPKMQGTAEEDITADIPDLSDATPQERLDAALDHMSSGRPGVARGILTNLADRDDLDDTLMAEVNYRLGETYFNEEDWVRAAARFARVTSRHPDSPWAPWAMLRAGECLGKQGRSADAKRFYEGVAMTWPSSEAAKEAQALLE